MNIQSDGGDAILQALGNLSVDCIVSSPGSEWSAVWEALARAKVAGTPAPPYHSCWHETLAVDIAIGYTLATGRMQAVLLHAGVGLLQGAAGVHAAHIQNVPMVVLSGEALTYGERPGFDPGQQWYQNLSVVGGPQRFAEPYVKWAGQAPSIDTLYETVMRAGHMAQRTPAGPVYVNVPIETMMQPWHAPSRLPKALPALAPRAPVPEIERVAGQLARAKNPVITTEAGGRSPESHAALLALAEALAIPVIETPSSLFDNFPQDHPLHQGASFKPFFDSADLALVVRSRVPWYPPAQRPPNASIVLIDENPYRPHMVYQSLHADAVLEGDATFTLETLRTACLEQGVDAPALAARRARHAASHARRDEARLAAVREAKPKRPIDPIWLCAALSEALPADTVYVDETVSNRSVVETYLRTQGPGGFLQVRGALGQCLGHALGAKLALKNRTVAAIVGDGSFLYNPVTQSLGFAAQAGLPILIVVFNNNEYRAMRETHLDYYPDGVAKQHNLFYGSTIGGPDYAELGAPFGAWGRKVEDPAALIPAIREAYAATLEGRTAILNVVLSR
jgi:acetolactate synthase I/II/III large subunit